MTEAIYIDDEGVSEEFKSEWQANDYLEQVKKSVSELDTAKALIDEYCREAVSYTHLDVYKRQDCRIPFMKSVPPKMW